MTTKLFRFRMDPRPNSYNPETRTFTAVVATSAPVSRGSHDEVISFEHFFSRGLPETLPLQADHGTSIRDTIGKVTNFRTETVNGVKALIADATLSSRADNEAIAANLKDGIQTGVSVGFNVSRWRTEQNPSTGRKTRTALAGSLFEVSLVVAPADENAKVRKMDPEDDVIDKKDEKDVQLRSLAKAAGVADTVIDQVLATDATEEQKMSVMLATLQAKPLVRSATKHNEETLDNPTVLRRAAVEAFDAIAQNKAAEGQAAQVFADGEVAFAKRLLRASGQEVAGLSDTTVLRNAAATSDYAIIAGATFNLSMRREYVAMASPLSALFGEAKVSTFNKETSGLVDWTTLQVGDKLENGNYRYSYIDESGETIYVATIGGVTAISRELSINAAGRLGNMGQKYGKRLAADIADRQVAFLEQSSGAGPTMKDTNPVFHTSRSNIKSLTLTVVPDIPSQIMDFRTAMAKRKGAGNVMIGSYPTHWLIHSDFERTALQVLTSYTANTIADVNPLAGKLQIVVEPRLSNPAKSWLVVEPSKMDGAVKVLLTGHEAPFTDSRQNFDTDAIDFKIRQDFGLGWLEWRSWTRLDHTT